MQITTNQPRVSDWDKDKIKENAKNYKENK